MLPLIASVIFIVGIAGLFYLDRERKASAPSWAIWLPIFWLLIAGSRHVSAWLQMTPAASADQYMEGSPVDRNVYLGILIAGIIVLLGRRNAVARILQKNWPIVLFIAFCAISVGWSDYPAVAAKRWIKSLGDYAMVLIILTERDRAAALKQVLARVGFVLLPISVLLIKYFPDWGRAYASHWEGTQFFVGVASDKNMLGMMCLVFGFAAVVRVLQGLRSPRKVRNKILIVHGVILVMALWLLKTSNSMTSLACFFMTSAVVATVMFSKTARKRWMVHLMVLTVIVAIFSVLFLSVGSILLETMGRNPTLTGRTTIWEAVLSIPVNPVVGTGFESFWLGGRLQRLWGMSTELDGINEAHNGYLEVYLNLGGIGLILLATLIISGYRNIVRLLPRDPEAGALRLGYFLIAINYNFTEAAIRSTDLVWITFLVAIIALPQAVRPRTQMAKPEAASPALVEAEQVV